MGYANILCASLLFAQQALASNTQCYWVKKRATLFGRTFKLNEIIMVESKLPGNETVRYSRRVCGSEKWASFWSGPEQDHAKYEEYFTEYANLVHAYTVTASFEGANFRRGDEIIVQSKGEMKTYFRVRDGERSPIWVNNGVNTADEGYLNDLMNNGQIK